jgi:hypothetical protein
LRRAEGGAKFVWVFRVKNHDFTSKNHIFSNCGGRRENFIKTSSARKLENMAMVMDQVQVVMAKR